MAWDPDIYMKFAGERTRPAGDERESLLSAYRARLRDAYPRRADGTTSFPFRRMFAVARR